MFNRISTEGIHTYLSATHPWSTPLIRNEGKELRDVLALAGRNDYDKTIWENTFLSLFEGEFPR